MNLEHQILAAVALDALVGDPQWALHPVRLIGRFASSLESPGRRLLRNPWLAGVAVALTVLGAAGLVSYGILVAAARLHPVAGDVAAVVLIYVTVAARDLVKHSAAVSEALAAGDLTEARRRTSLIVGRDTQNLDEPEVSRAAVESVAESTVDGVTAPLFFAFLAGPVGAVVYRAVNTLDSTFGYKDERYLRFGWASARIDDTANFVPARLTGPLMALAAALLYRRGGESWRILRRDARKHSSPNAGIPEAAMAGALGVRLGGVSFYAGEPVEKPTIGDPAETLSREHIARANRLMWVTLLLFLALCAGSRQAFLAFLGC